MNTEQRGSRSAHFWCRVDGLRAGGYLRSALRATERDLIWLTARLLSSTLTSPGSSPRQDAEVQNNLPEQQQRRQVELRLAHRLSVSILN